MNDIRIAVIGLGYVGLPVAVALANKFPTIGFDVDERRVETLRNGEDWTDEVESEKLAASDLTFTTDTAALKDRNFFVVAVPTPVTSYNRPDMSLLKKACQLIGPHLPEGATVVFESTVYPGATEEICGPELEQASGKTCGEGFKLAYSPERINPGDREHPLEKIVKVVSGQDAETLELVANVYGAIIEAGVHRAPNIKVAETAKVIENTQRDINIALMNELSKICHLVGIRTQDVLSAAGTKWNFLPFTPGLVGGHCIGVDPYYLTSKAEALGYHPEVILSGRRINDDMSYYLVDRIVHMLIGKDRSIRNARIGILGLTFKENVPDLRNSKVVDMYKALQGFGVEPMVSDPLANPEEAKRAYDIDLRPLDELKDLDALIYAVPHDTLSDQLKKSLPSILKEDGLLIDLKSKIDPASLPESVTYWSL